MSLPSFPEKDKTPTREEVVNQILSSIAMEELGLSHVINAEGEKIQYALGTIEGMERPKEPATIEDLLELNKSVRETLDSTMMNQFFLKEKMAKALSSSVMQGPAGPVGTILDSYDNLDDLKKEHPTGKQGDAYLVAGELYVWDTEKNEWKSVGNLTGPAGPQGTGTTIKGSYDSLEDFERNPPQGSPDDAYIVDGELYIWNKDDGWHSAGSLRGPQGIGTLIKDSYPSLTDLQRDHPDGPPEDAYLIDGKLYVWSKEKGWHAVGDLRGPEATSYTVIPFASGEAPFTYSNNGRPSRVSLIGFGYGDRRDYSTLWASDYSIVLDQSDHSFSLTGNSNKQVVFSLPFNMILKSLYITVGNYGTFNPTGEVVPYVQLYKADPGTNNFTPIIDAVAMPDTGIGPGRGVAADTMRHASVDGLNVPLEAGTRIAIGGMMRIKNDTELGEKIYWLYFTGGIGLAYNPNPTP